MFGIWDALAAITLGPIPIRTIISFMMVMIIACSIPGALVGAALRNRSYEAGYLAGHNSPTRPAEPRGVPAPVPVRAYADVVREIR